ncbi:DNA-directed RNA polymerase subunit L [Candidatus Micrarchaeota archaeon]|nr:DNA-directed RNA polymerase subunit L [Candidatus Micrarchaeota archaeon]
MQMLSKEKDYLEIKLEGLDVGLANLIAEKLLASKSVTFAASAPDHPLTGNPILKIKGRGPEKGLKKALEKIKDELKEFENAFEEG